MKRTALLLGFLFIALAAGAQSDQVHIRPRGDVQPLRAPETFQLGADREQVHALFGAPVETKAPQSLLSSDVLIEVYSRRTLANEYEVELAYGADTRASRLHQVLRVTSIEFVLDKPRPAPEVLRDLPEAREVCAPGCRMTGFLEAFGYEIWVYLVSPSDQQREFASSLAGRFKDKPADTSRTLGLYLSWEQGRSTPAPAPNWQTQPIERVLIGAMAVEANARNAARSAAMGLRPPAVELGDWPPTPESGKDSQR